MELKDLTSAATMDIRGGSNAIGQSSYNGPATGLVGVHGSKFNLSPVSITSDVLQQNGTVQMAAIDDQYKRDLSLTFDQSQLHFGGFRLF
ncbi:MAG: hypothetical protein AAGG11_16540 [Pseudomonadota bacterium]